MSDSAIYTVEINVLKMKLLIMYDVGFDSFQLYLLIPFHSQLNPSVSGGHGGLR